MTTSYKQLLESRKNYRDGKVHGLEWDPYPTQFQEIDESYGIKRTIGKILELAIQLEMPVGAWIGEATKRELPISDHARSLLLSNITDETVHQKAFEYLLEGFTVNADDIREAAFVGNEWIDNDDHPLLKAAVAECGVFLVTLTIMRSMGSESISFVSANVSRDENRHVATNCGVLSDIGYQLYQPDSKIDKLRIKTLEWALSDLTLPGMDKDFFLSQSHQLMENRRAPELESLTAIAEDLSSFEIPNYSLY